MGLIGASHAAAARVPPGERIEVEPCLGAGMTDSLQTAAALSARDRRGTPVANGDEMADLGLGGVDHLGSRLRIREESRASGEEILAPVVSRL
jgi:hypothetical protein